MSVNLDRSFFEEPLLLSTVAITIFIFYRILTIYSGVTLDNECLYTVWLPYEDQYYSPFWLLVTIVVCLTAWALLSLVISIKKGMTQIWYIAYYIFAIAAFIGWFYTLWYFWHTMQFERGLITELQYFGFDNEYNYGHFGSGHEFCKGL